MRKLTMVSHCGLLKRILCLSLFLMGVMSYSQQQTVVSGSVVSATDNGPLPGATILEKGTNNGVQTDFDGNFSISVATDGILVVSYIGFETIELPVNGNTTFQIALNESATGLDEVVVVGYGKTVKKEDLTGAVSLVGAKDIEKAPLVNVDQALQGRAAGVQLTQSSGAPGAGFKIRVRGSNSITGNNDPLVVVDGLIDVDINSVNPADIQSISVLKDASATAIYGNRGANGVVIITTKRGYDGKSTVEFSTYVSFSDVVNTLDLLGPAEFIEFANIKNIAASGVPVPVFGTQEQIDALVANGVDYQDELYRTAIAQNYQLSFRGGSDKMNYFVSSNYLDQEGIAINSNFKRYALRANINADLSEKLSLVSSVNLIRQEGYNNNPNFGETLARGATGFDPVTPIFDENGNYNRTTIVLGGIQSSVETNPIFLARESQRETNTNRVQANLQLNYNLFKNLDFNINTGVNYRNRKNNNFGLGNRDDSPITASQASNDQTRWQYAFRLTYDNVFDEKHTLTASAIYENRGVEARGFNANGTGFFTPGVGFDNLGLADLQTISSDFTSRELRSVIGRATYNYDSRYLVTASARYDQSSVFVNDQSAVFPSFALGWNINNESFFNSESISLLRLRAGWGQTGNELIGTTDALNLLRNNPFIPNGGNVGSTAILPGTRLANPDLTWETTSQTNVGLDLGLFNNKLNLTVEYYQKNTEDLLLVRSVPRFTGRSDQVVNAGEVENKGVDVTLSGIVLQKGDFLWDYNINFSTNKNEVVGLVDDLDEIFPNLTIGPDPAPTIVRVGAPLGSFYGFVFEGVDASDGNAVYAEERDIIGDPNPDYTFGINSNMSYKGFDLNFFIQGVQGNDIFNQTRSLILGRSGRIPFGTSTELRNTWTAGNTTAPLPSLNATNTQLLSSEFIEDGSFVRLKNISLGYTLRDSNALEGLGIESLRFYVSGQNLITITDYSGVDPEISNEAFDDRLAGIDAGAYPTAKTFTLGLDCKF